MFTLRTLVTIVSLGLIATACTQKPRNDAPVTVINLPETGSAGGSNVITDSSFSGDYSQLSKLDLLDGARSSNGTTASAFYLELSQRFLDVGDVTEANKYLSITSTMPKDANLHIVGNVINARIAVRQHNYASAHNKANLVQEDTLSDVNKTRLNLVNAEIAASYGDIGSIDILSNACISNADNIESACWLSANSIAGSFNEKGINITAFKNKTSLIISQLTEAQKQPFALNFTSSRLFNASSADALERAMAKYSQNPPPVIGALLPISSRFSTAAHSTYKGMQAAIEVLDPAQRPRLVLVDIGDNENDINNHIDSAKKQGVNIFVGPLGTNYAAKLNPALLNGAPHLALSNGCDKNNSFETENCVRFSLSPESEASFIYEKLTQSGFKNPSIIYSQNRWGERFRAELISLFKGEHISFIPFAPETEDFTDIVKPIFENTMVDSVVIASTSHQARLIKPQITYHANSKVPVLATSTIYGGTQNPIQDIDLSGTQIPILPIDDIDDPENTNLQLNAAIYWPDPSADSVRFYALGHDAVLLSDKIFNNVPIYQLNGRTGLLSKIGQNVERKLEWGKFSEGLVEKEIPNAIPGTAPVIVGDEEQLPLIQSDNDVSSKPDTEVKEDDQSIIKGDYD